LAVLKAGSDGVELVQRANGQLPQVMDQISLDTIGYSDQGDVLLSGRAQGQSVVRVYLDNRAVTELDVLEDGRWKGKLDGVDPGVYTLRLDELGKDGKVLSRLETPFKREAPDRLILAAKPGTPPSAGQPLIRAVTVQKGDTLWAISRERYGEGILYVRVFEANRTNIRNPDLIYPGQVFALPD
jgi:LysM repeat protein